MPLIRPQDGRLDDVEVENNWTGYYAELSQSLTIQAALLKAVQAKCRKALNVEMAPAAQPAAAATGLPQSPLAVPSRRRPFGSVREESLWSSIRALYINCRSSDDASSTS